MLVGQSSSHVAPSCNTVASQYNVITSNTVVFDALHWGSTGENKSVVCL